MSEAVAWAIILMVGMIVIIVLVNNDDEGRFS